MPGVYLHGFDETTGLPVRCKVTSEGKLIVNAASIVENPPVEDEALKAPTSEWAYDHWKNANAHHTPPSAGSFNHQDLANRSADDHHTPFTAADARAAINDLFNSQGYLTKVLYCQYKSLYNLSRMQFKHEDTPTDWMYMMPDRGGQIMKLYGYVGGVGTSAAFFHIYDGAAYQAVIDAGTFQSYLDDYLESSPTEDSVNTAPTSEWAFDHNADTAKHHTKYTDLEARMSFFDSRLLLQAGTFTNQTVAGIGQILLLSAAGDIILKGLADGAEGQMIFCYKVGAGNAIQVIHASGDAAAGDKIYPVSAGDESIAAGNYGGFWLIYASSIWIVDHVLV